MFDFRRSSLDFPFERERSAATLHRVAAPAVASVRRAYDAFGSRDILIPLSAAAAIAAYGFYLKLW